MTHDQFKYYFVTKDDYKKYIGSDCKFGTKFEIRMLVNIYERKVVIYIKVDGKSNSVVHVAQEMIQKLILYYCFREIKQEDIMIY